MASVIIELQANPATTATSRSDQLPAFAVVQSPAYVGLAQTNGGAGYDTWLPSPVCQAKLLAGQGVLAGVLRCRRAKA